MKFGSLRRSLSWSLIGNVYFAAAQWLLLVVIAKFGSAAMVGQFSICLAIVTPIMTLTNLQLRVVQATDTQNQYMFRDLMGLRLLTIVVSVLLALIAVFAFGYDSETAMVLGFVLLAKAVESASDVSHGVFQKHENMRALAISKIIKGTIAIPVFAAILQTSGSLVWAAFGWMVSWLISLFIYDLPKTKRYEAVFPRIRWKECLRVVKICLPLGIVFMLTSLNTNIPRFFIERSVGVEQLGLFTAVSYLLVAGSTVVSALGQAATFRLAKSLDDKEFGHFYRLTYKLMGLGLAMGLLGIAAAAVAGKTILTLLYTAEYAQYSTVFLIVTVAGLIDYVAVFGGYGLSATKKFGVQPYLGLIWTAAVIVSCFFLVPAYGVEGAAYSLVVSSFVRLVAQWIALRLITSKMRKVSNRERVILHETIV